MVHIISPSTNARILRSVVTAAVVTVMGTWFLYDGYIGYPRENITKAIESLNPVPDELPRIDAGVTKQLSEDLAAELHEGRLARALVYERLGEPAWLNEAGDDARYFGPGGMLGVSFKGDVVEDLFFNEGVKDDIELMWQKLLAGLMLPIGFILILQTLRVLTTKFVLDDNGLTLGGRRAIPFDAMTGLDASKFRQRGFVVLQYSVNGLSKRARLDDYVIRDHRAIITEICTRRDFENPLSPNASEATDTP